MRLSRHSWSAGAAVNGASSTWYRRQRLLLIFFLIICQSGPLHSFVTAWKLPFSRNDSNDATTSPRSNDKINRVRPHAADHFAPDVTKPVDLHVSSEHLGDVSKSWLARRVRQIPTPLVALFEHLVALVLYKPPVGIVTIFTVTRLIVTGRLFRLYPAPKKHSVEEMIMSQHSRKSRNVGRALQLDRDDAAYHAEGGLEAIRRRLCQAALLPDKDGSATAAAATTTHPVVQALAVTNRPGSARVYFLQESITPMARLEQEGDDTKPSLLSWRGNNDDDTQLDRQIVHIATWTAQVRVTDALLRVCRDRLLRTAFRLARTREHWKRHIAASSRGWWGPIWQYIVQDSMEGDRRRLSYAEAAYRAEVERLGLVATVLMERPADLSEQYLIEALKETEVMYKERKEEKRRERKQQRNASNNTILHWLPEPIQDFKVPNFRSYSIRWNADGRHRLSIRKLDATSGDIASLAAQNALRSAQQEAWMRQAEAWTKRARKTLCQVVRTSLQSSVAEDGYSDDDWRDVQGSWCEMKKMDNHDAAEAVWAKLVMYVDNLSKWRRVGEGRVIRLKDAAVIDWTRRLDVCGIPSTMLYIVGANYVHTKLLPYWPAFRETSERVFWKAIEIFEERFYTPLKGIYDDIMNKNQGIFSAFGLEIEQRSLDRMLRDMGCGDGTPQMRTEALRRAAELYERDLNSGIFRNIVKGRLVRELLVQVQQLKVGLLTALDTIDALLKGNRIHFQILAAIPAVLMATYGTRFIARRLYHIRSRDLRPISAVHAEMGEYLQQMERLLILSDQADVTEDGDVVDKPPATSTTSSSLFRSSPGASSLRASNNAGRSRNNNQVVDLTNVQLGELLLQMHRYLLLMDYTSPQPFPHRHCAVIHTHLQDMLGPDGTLTRRLSEARHAAMLHLIQRKHQDLLRHL